MFENNVPISDSDVSICREFWVLRLYSQSKLMAFDNLVLQKLQDSLIVMLLPFEVILVQDEQLFEAVSFRLDFFFQ